MRELQLYLDSIASISWSWNLKLNPAKCVVMRFGSRNVTSSPNYSIFGTPLSSVTKFRDLGVIVDSALRFHCHIDLVVGRTSSMMINILRSTVCRTVKFMVTLWVSHLRPLIEYGSCVWNVGYLGDLRRLESLQRRWTREAIGMCGLDYEERLRRIGLFSVEGRLLRIDLVKVWKCFHG